jgi:prevent-host-death family protein
MNLHEGCRLLLVKIQDLHGKNSRRALPFNPEAAALLANMYRYLYSFCMTMMRNVHELSVTEAARRGVAGLVAEAEQGADLVVTRHNHPVAAVVSIARLALLEAVESDLRDLALVLARAATDTGRRTSLDDVLAAFGHTRDSLAALPEDD